MTIVEMANVEWQEFTQHVLVGCSHVCNLCAESKALKTITPYEAWKGHKLTVSHMRAFGCFLLRKVVLIILL